MPNTLKPGAVIFAMNLELVAKFYEELVPMAVAHVERNHIVLESERIQLVIHAIPKRVADSIDIAELPVVREQTPIKLFFPVSSLAEARVKAALLGGRLGPSQNEWEARGFRACDGHDPEGNVFQLRQDAP